MRYSTWMLGVILLAGTISPALAQFKEGDPGGAKLGASAVQKWQAGIIVTAVGGPCKSIVGYAPIPSEWPEQTIKTSAQDVSPAAKISYQTVDDVRVMVVRIPLLNTNEEAKVLLTFDIQRSVQLPPENKESFVLPNAKKADPAISRYLVASPKIEVRDPKIRQAAKDCIANKKTAWDKVEALYDWTREQVKYKTGGSCKGAVASLKSHEGGHEDMSSLFIALCRSVGIPARTVWVPEFCYAEFYLEDAKGEGHWFPCSPAGARTFGEMPDTKPILQKGDNFKPPYKTRDPKERQRLLREYLTGTPTQNGGKPRVQFVRKLVN